jgi:DNA-binding transcriptional MerR regulator
MIGDFARRCRLPVSTLRYYDRIGLLAPAAVDPSSGYRRYTAVQVPAAVLIARLRAIGTAPQAIAAVLAGGAPAGAALAAERRRLEDQARDAQRALAELDDLRTALRRSGCARAGPWGATFPLEITDQVSGLVFARAERLSRPPGVATAWLPAARAVRDRSPARPRHARAGLPGGAGPDRP